MLGFRKPDTRTAGIVNGHVDHSLSDEIPPKRILIYYYRFRTTAASFHILKLSSQGRINVPPQQGTLSVAPGGRAAAHRHLEVGEWDLDIRLMDFVAGLSIGQKLLAGHPLNLVSTWELLLQDAHLPPMIMPVKRLEDVTATPNVTVRTSSEEGLHSPTDTLSSTKEDMESAGEPHSTEDMTTTQFPEGGRQAWLTVLGGHVSCY
ncbi:hypothetical protein FPV67DRAFT_1670218 [Lyophyllum atratum]|nr:hypothetical protein FPV67DRAFT_1670218 [Lyophyllum atratum]